MASASATNLMMFVSVVFQLFVIFVQLADSYPNGPPISIIPDLCSTMYPQHGALTQTTAAPFTITVKGPNGVACYTPGIPINVNISAVGNDTTFSGFLMEARQAPVVNASYGTFNSAGNAIVSPYNCFGQNNNVIGHNQDVDSTSNAFNWTAPAGFSGNITFLATVVEDETIFWVQGVQLTVTQCISGSITTNSSVPVTMATVTRAIQNSAGLDVTRTGKGIFTLIACVLSFLTLTVTSTQ